MVIRDYITVVSGMPRSGTSLMMQMLEAGGIPPLTDDVRPPDAHNPRGYFEYEPVKRLAQDASWMGGARGKAVKIIYRLLPHLPQGLQYRVVFMERDLGEVFESQRDMLRARGDSAVEQREDGIAAAFALELQETRRWLTAAPNIRTIFAPFAEIISDPTRWSIQLSNFLDGLDVSAMAAAVNPELRHHWKGSSRVG